MNKTGGQTIELSNLQPLRVGGRHYRVKSLRNDLGRSVDHLPYALRVMVENTLWQDITAGDAHRVMDRNGDAVSFYPSRLIMQDMLALPLFLDVMLLREKILAQGGNKQEVEPALPIDLIIDHSMTLLHWAGPDALRQNQSREFEINRERFAFFKTCAQTFRNLRVVPPGGGIMHQVNLEFLGAVTEQIARLDEPPVLRADTVLGTDSHTPMINGLGILGWGIGGLDAEAIMFGRPMSLNVPNVVGVRLTGRLSDTATATDLALHMAELLRKHDVVGDFIELFGPSYYTLAVPDRATVANMAPEYGATCVYCPIDENTLRYLRETGRTAAHVARVDAWARTQEVFVDSGGSSVIEYDRVLELDLSTIKRSVSGPARPEQRMDAGVLPNALLADGETNRFPVEGQSFDIGNDDVIIAAITSCTNTANPRNMIAAGLFARNAVRAGLKTKPWVKTSLAPGSRAVALYLEDSGLQDDLDALGFQVAGFACTTCNGMSGPLAPGIEEAIDDHELACAAVLSGNRNFAGRIHSHAAQNFLAAPPLVIAYAIAGTTRGDVTSDTLGTTTAGHPVTLHDLWPERSEIDALCEQFVLPGVYLATYAEVDEVSPEWSAIKRSDATPWTAGSTYITRPPYLDGPRRDLHDPATLAGLRPLAVLGDGITTDHISPSGYITEASAAGQFLLSQGVAKEDFNSYGTRRGSTDIVVRSTFSNNRIKNDLADGRVGPWTRLLPDNEIVSMWDAISRYRKQNQPLILIAGKNYGGGSSRDTAARAPWLAGVRAVLAESYERIHRSNLINMGIVPLLFALGDNRKSLLLVDATSVSIRLNDDLNSAEAIICYGSREGEPVAVIPAIQTHSERDTLLAGGMLREIMFEF